MFTNLSYFHYVNVKYKTINSKIFYISTDIKGFTITFNFKLKLDKSKITLY